ncbi:MAG: hypothetical protein KF718_07800 [Polyangiaceae bacterium]|nr:hypothetical protein [Polyangiaceae bacterium]
MPTPGCPADEAPSAWSITGLAMGWGGLPYVGVSGELGFSHYAGASLVLGTWYTTVSYDSLPPIIESGYTHLLGANAAAYPYGGLEGLRLGFEAAYAVTTNDHLHGPRAEEDSLGAGFVIFIGHKVIRKSGFTFVTDLGMGSRLLLRLGIGWSG